MRVALFTETYLPTINGVVTHVKTLKDGLEALGHTVLVVTADSRFNNHVVAEDVMYCPAVRVKKIYNYDVAPPISIERLEKIKNFAPDIIHIHNEFGVGISGILIARQLNVPLVYTLHTMYDDYVYYVAKKAALGKLVTSATHFYAKMLAATASAITGPSLKVSEYFKKCGVKKKIYVIPNSVELDKFDPDNIDRQEAVEFRRSLGFADDDTVFCFCGRLGKEKNVTLLLKYWAEHVKPTDKLKLYILGEGPLYEQHVEEAQQFGISDTVKFAGRVEHDDLLMHYACCDAYITASLSDTCSISMLEGMAMHLPVLSLADRLNEGQVIDGVNGYNFKNSTEMYELMKKIRDMSDAELSDFGERTRDSIKTSGAVRLANDLLEVYRDAQKNYALKRGKNRRIVKKRYRAIKRRTAPRTKYTVKPRIERVSSLSKEGFALEFINRGANHISDYSRVRMSVICGGLTASMPINLNTDEVTMFADNLSDGELLGKARLNEANGGESYIEFTVAGNDKYNVCGVLISENDGYTQKLEFANQVTVDKVRRFAKSLRSSFSQRMNG
ncbi:MAG: glycosyltransferase [Eubacterium sp.]|nr:glycosyltransferase [Eubacterium sp.]